MQSFFSDYGSLIAPIAAILNGFIAVVVAQFFKDHTFAKILLVLAAGVLGAAAIAATILGQREAIVQRAALQAHHQEIRDTIGKFIAEGWALQANCGDKSTPPDEKSTIEWATRVVEYVRTRLGQSYADRVLSPAGVPIVACNGADDAHNKMYRLVYAVNFHLEQFSTESASWP
jgi:hypothetical protein